MTAFLSPLQVRALEALATYRFLDRKQLQRVGVAKDPNDLRVGLSVLVNKGLIGRTEKPPTLPGIGRLPHLYWLYQAGADVLADLNDEEQLVSARTRTYAARNEIPHLCAVVDAHIALREWAAASGATMDWFKGDYEPSAARGQKATSLPYGADPAGGRAAVYTPDAVAQVTLADGIPRLLVFEVYRGGWRYTLSHFRGELAKLRRVCETEAVEEHHRNEGQARFLVLFHDAEMRDKALARWRDAEAEAFSSFFVKSWDELAGDFAGGWRQPGRPARTLF